MASSPVWGQSFSAAICGVVRDATGAMLPGVSVTAKHTESGLTRTVITNETGNYSMPSLPVGAYEVTAELMGFKQQVRRGVILAVTQEAVVNLTLEVGDLKEQVTVTEEAPLVNTTLSSTAGLVTNEQIKDLPLNGRSFLELMTLNPGVITNRSNTTDKLIGGWQWNGIFSATGGFPITPQVGSNRSGNGASAIPTCPI